MSPTERVQGVDDENLGLDEIYLTDVTVHLERLDEARFWCRISRGDTSLTFELDAEDDGLIVHEFDVEGAPWWEVRP